jgi:osmotically-inducible protein OsmY
MVHITLKNDAQIRDDVLEELRWDSRVEETEVGIQVKDGVVTLAGSVDCYAKKLAAQEAAHRVSGVLDVANDLEVCANGSRTPGDPEIARAVRHALEWDVFIPADSIRSTVMHGWVTLEGTVQNGTERDDTARVVQRLRGVQGVTNNIAVKPPGLEAAAIRKTIERALKRRADHEAVCVQIGVEDGVVSLQGRVRSARERAAIELAVRSTTGVQRIDDQLIVDPCASGGEP